MNLTNRPVYQKTPKANKLISKKQIEWREQARALGCCVKNHECEGATEMHHIGTGAGGKKNHDKQIPLCNNHHVGKRGIHTIGRKIWQAEYGTEETHLEAVKASLTQKGYID